MLGVLALMHRQSVPVQVNLHSRTASGVSPRPAETSKFFGESVAALALTAFDNVSIYDASGSDRRGDLRTMQEQVLRDGRGYLSSGREVTAPE